jgi:flagellar hook-associated protein 3 FlgL
MIRISTSMIYDAGVSAINRQTADMFHLQQQVATGRRMLVPADDPVAAARALDVRQGKDINAQFVTNLSNAKSTLGMEETQLAGVTDMFGRLHELAIQATNGTLSASSRKGIAVELRARFDQLMGLANSTDGTGQYVFSGYMGSTKPFGGNVDALAAGTAAEATYLGDDGQRTLQVAPSRHLEVSDAGNDVFMRIKNGNGSFTTNYAAGNTGTGIVDVGSVTNPAAWVAPTSGTYEIRFMVAAGVTTYQIYDGATALLAVPATYNSGQSIALQKTTAPPADYGASVTIKGDPATGDSFTLAPSSSQSLFKTLAKLIGTVESNPIGAAGQAKFSADISSALANLDNAQANVLAVRAAVGSRLNEVDSLENVNTDLDLQYQQTLSKLEDIDYAKTISDLTRKQTDLEAAQKSFALTTKLSLFNYL